MFSTPLIWFSSGAATVCSITSADAPGYTARTVTTGGAISGYWPIGRVRIEARPAMTMNVESTAAKIGRSMKKREIMRISLFGVGDARRRRLHERARRDLHDAVDDHPLTGLQSRFHDPA